MKMIIKRANKYRPGRPGTIPAPETMLVPLEGQVDERRPCWARGKKAFFHRWVNSAHPVLPRGVEPSDKAHFFQFRSTRAIVEYETGCIECVYPSEIQFADGGGFEGCAWLPMVEVDNG